MAEPAAMTRSFARWPRVRARGVSVVKADDISGKNFDFSPLMIPKSEKPSKKQNGSKKRESFPQKPDLEYIQLKKISENQYEDPPDKYSMAKRHHSGHFRHANAEVWDPHPQYEFTAFGRRFRLRLAHDASFVSRNIKITHMGEDTTRREYPGHELGCFYSGTVDGDPYSAVTVSLCHGMWTLVRAFTTAFWVHFTANTGLDHARSRLDMCHGNARTSFRIILANAWPSGAVHLSTEFGSGSRSTLPIDFSSYRIVSSQSEDALFFRHLEFGRPSSNRLKYLGDGSELMRLKFYETFTPLPPYAPADAADWKSSNAFAHYPEAPWALCQLLPAGIRKNLEDSAVYQKMPDLPMAPSHSEGFNKAALKALRALDSIDLSEFFPTTE
ncbi:A disintegrin and metalloproteinase with thrombospondin motifs 8 [Eufriesea mexicana]|nr:A disintegrin and metalloproteinase with thrombospondin motifs 8 [Eufriesea mexicana]